MGPHWQKLTGSVELSGVKIPSKVARFDAGKVIIAAEDVESKQTYTVSMVVSDKDQEGKKTAWPWDKIR